MRPDVVFGLTSGLLAAIAGWPYIASILRGQTIPSRAAYLIWSAANLVTLASYVAAGASTTIWFVVVMTVEELLILLLAIRHGTGGHTKFDLLCLTAALAAVILWVASGDPQIAVYAGTATLALGFFPIARKSLVLPWAESLKSWTLCVIAALLNLAALNTLAPSVSLLPVTTAIGCVWVFVVLARGRWFEIADNAGLPELFRIDPEWIDEYDHTRSLRLRLDGVQTEIDAEIRQAAQKLSSDYPAVRLEGVSVSERRDGPLTWHAEAEDEADGEHPLTLHLQQGIWAEPDEFQAWLCEHRHQLADPSAAGLIAHEFGRMLAELIRRRQPASEWKAHVWALRAHRRRLGLRALAHDEDLVAEAFALWQRLKGTERAHSRDGVSVSDARWTPRPKHSPQVARRTFAHSDPEPRSAAHRVRGAIARAGSSSVAPRGIVPQPGRRPISANKVAFSRHHAIGGRNHIDSTNPQAVSRSRSRAP
jgi:hypothetical protein